MAEVAGSPDPSLIADRLRRTSRALRNADGRPDLVSRRSVWDLLDVVRSPDLLRRIDPAERGRWAADILEAVEVSHFTVGPLFRHRAERYGSKVLFEQHVGGKRHAMTWSRAASRVEALARGLMALEDGRPPGRVAILSENRLEAALMDLACLTSGRVDVLIPANATEADVGYILEHSRASHVVVSRDQLHKVAAHRAALPGLKTVISLDAPGAAPAEVLGLERLLALADRTSPAAVLERSEAVRIDELATIMYTSGTTGMPKGIQFSHRNVVFKRFARALALPGIGDTDVFLCFLPLFHTFGRFLEMLGCVFWGARYCFLHGSSLAGLQRGMRLYRPTVFISVPKKWLQLYELIGRQADPLEAGDAELLAATHRATGGRLAWGLSAAGHLDPDVFRFFQRQGIELVSGYGMTEATGGMTMTAPGDYRDGSLGRALPGIELDLAEDGELLMRGPYVMLGYLDPPDGESGFDERGWFHTGDLMQVDPDGHYQLVDRKKEIYKNVKGETIAPQRVENLFRDFESVGRALLVGDHREYSTLLIYPNPRYAELDFSTLSAQEVQDHFRSLIVSVNQFLAPYERIVDFAVIDRDLDPERGELTPKGTPRRKIVEDRFASFVRPMYRRTNLHVGGLEVTFPNWLFQVLGLTAQSIRCDDGRIVLTASGTGLTVGRVDGLARVGSCVYRHRGGPINLGTLLTTPRIWLGNEELVGFAPLDAATRQRPERGNPGILWSGRSAPFRPAEEDYRKLETAIGRDDQDIMDLDLAARMIGAEEERAALLGVRLMESVLGREESPLAGTARLLLGRLSETRLPEARRRAFCTLITARSKSHPRDVLRRFLVRDPGVLDPITRAQLKERNLPAERIETLMDIAQEACMRPASSSEGLTGALLDFLAEYGTVHPMRYRSLRAFLERMGVFGRDEGVRDRAVEAARELTRGFRQWLEPTATMAVDPETGQEYSWKEVVVFDEDVPAVDRERIQSAIRDTAFLREALFLFSTGTNIRLSDIPPGGVWIRSLGSLHGKSVYRITVQTRFQGSHDLAVNVNHELRPEQVREEVRWLILSGDPGNRDPLVENFGGYWPEQDLWSEEFIVGETLYRALRRLSRQPAQEERLKQLWPFMAWATLSAYVDFWHRSGKRLEIADPGLTNVVVPTEDYHSDVRLVSLSRRRPHRGVAAMLRSFHQELILPAEELHPILAGLAGWNEILSSILEVVGETEGLAWLRKALAEPEAVADDGALAKRIRTFVEEVERRGFIPLRLFFAIARYRRWAALSTDATPQARAETLQELFDTYGLQTLAERHPEIRVRFFRETIFRDAPDALGQGLEKVIQRMRRNELGPEELIHEVDELRALGPSPDDEYFLARLSYPFLRPEDAAGFVRGESGGKRLSEIVVTLRDDDGNEFSVRHALNPKEIERLHRLFLAAKLDVRFRMEHEYLLAINERGQIIAGIYYEIDQENRTSHLEKIVVAERYRRRGVANGLMLDFFNRLRAAGVSTVTTGFFRPEYFYGFGFRIEKRYAGLVKSLEEDGTRPPDRP